MGFGCFGGGWVWVWTFVRMLGCVTVLIFDYVFAVVCVVWIFGLFCFPGVGFLLVLICFLAFVVLIFGLLLVIWVLCLVFLVGNVMLANDLSSLNG